MTIRIFGAETVRFNIKDKDTGKDKAVDSCRCCLAIYNEAGVCTSFETYKTNSDFANWCDENRGYTFEGTLMFDKFGRAVYIHGERI